MSADPQALKPCPFCGGAAEFERIGTGRRSCIVVCTDCGCRLETGETWDSGTAWNRAHARLALNLALEGCCPDCGGSGIGSDACDGPGHHTPPCPSCEGSGLAPGARRMAAQRNAAWAERDAALARVTELEAPGECNGSHKLRAQVAALQAAIERVRPVVDELAAAWDCGSPMMIRHLMERLGRAAYTSRVEDAAWLRSLLLTAPDPAHRPGHTDLMVAPESVPDLAPQLRAQVADLQAVVERVRPVVDVLAGACSRCAEGTITDVATRAFAGLMIPMGRGDDTFDVAAAWLRSLLLTAPEAR